MKGKYLQVENILIKWLYVTIINWISKFEKNLEWTITHSKVQMSYTRYESYSQIVILVWAALGMNDTLVILTVHLI